MPQRRWGTDEADRDARRPQDARQGSETGSVAALAERLARAEAALDQARFGNQVLESQLRRLVRDTEERTRRFEDERDRLAARAEELEATVRGIRASKSWKLASLLRRLAGRKW